MIEARRVIAVSCGSSVRGDIRDPTTQLIESFACARRHRDIGRAVWDALTLAGLQQIDLVPDL